MAADPWDWQDDCFKLDGESPLEITRCLWDELSHTEEDSLSLFSTPLTDIATQDTPFYSFRSQQDADSLEERFCNSGLHGSSIINSPRTKRRRLLFCEPDPIYDTHAEHDGGIESFTDCLDPTMIQHDSTMMPVCNSGLQNSMDVNSLQNSSFWYRHCDDLTGPFGEVEPGCQNWIVKSMDGGESIDPKETNSRVDPGSKSTVQCQNPTFEEDMIQGPRTPLPGRSPPKNSKNFDKTGQAETKKQQQQPQSPPVVTYKKQQQPQSPPAVNKKQQSSSPPPTAHTKSCTPVAYPFTLLKPSETEGGVTLKDINQRILMPPPLRPLPHLQRQHQAGDESSWSVGGCCSPTDQGLGLSGKSIVARTKIHTEGNGTITIMRTRG